MRGQVFLGQPELHGQPYQFGLGAIVEISFEAAQACRCLVDRAGTCPLELAEPGRQ